MTHERSTSLRIHGGDRQQLGVSTCLDGTVRKPHFLANAIQAIAWIFGTDTLDLDKDTLEPLDAIDTEIDLVDPVFLAHLVHLDGRRKPEPLEGFRKQWDDLGRHLRFMLLTDPSPIRQHAEFTLSREAPRTHFLAKTEHLAWNPEMQIPLHVQDMWKQLETSLEGFDRFRVHPELDFDFM